MNRAFLIVSAFLVGCATSAPSEYRQAAAVMRPPAVRPVVNEPYFPTPGATPSGAGAYRGDPLPAAPVPRSPNKRILPATREPGIWAADGAPVAMARHQLWGVEIPLPDGGAYVEREAWQCAAGMDEVSTATKKVSTIASATEAARRCMVAIAQYTCAFELGLSARKQPTPGDTDRLLALAVLEARAAELRNTWCAGVTLTDKQRTALRVVLDAWIESQRRGE